MARQSIKSEAVPRVVPESFGGNTLDTKTISVWRSTVIIKREKKGRKKERKKERMKEKGTLRTSQVSQITTKKRERERGRE